MNKTIRWLGVGFFVVLGCGEPPKPAVSVETRAVTNPWTKVVQAYPGITLGPQNLALLTDGSVLASDITLDSVEPWPFDVTARNTRWYRLQPTTAGSYANGTWTAAGTVASSNLGRDKGAGFVLVDGRYMICGGEYVTDRYELASHPLNQAYSRCEIYDPMANTWTEQTPMPEMMRDTPVTEVDPTGSGMSKVLALASGGSASPYLFTTPAGWSAPLAPYDTSAIESEGDCILLPTGNVFCGASGFSTYSPSPNNTWTPAPYLGFSLLSTDGGFRELGPMVLLYPSSPGSSGEVMVLGANSDNINNRNADSAIFNPAKTSWRMALAMPASTPPLNHGDTPAAVMRNGHVLVTSSTDDRGVGGLPGILHEYDPRATTTATAWLPVTPPTSGLTAGEFMRMLDLPNGQVLVTGTPDNSVWLYTPNGTPDTSWRPTINPIPAASGGGFTLSGTQLNGLTTGANYGDDSKMATNYPIVYLTSGSSVYYARSFGFSRLSPAPGATSSCKFTLPLAIPNGSYSVHVSANGVDSNTQPLTVTGNHVTGVTLTDPLHGKVTLASAAAAGTRISLQSSNTSTITVPATVTVPTGATSVTFPATMVAFGGASVSANLFVANPQFPAALVQMGWRLESLLGPSVVYGDRAQASSVTWTVSLSAPAPTGAIVKLSSSILPLGSTLVATVPSSVGVPVGATSATFPVLRTGNRGLAKITASIKGPTPGQDATRSYTFSDRDTDFFKCADQNGTCATPTASQRMIAFGANGAYVYQRSSGPSFSCVIGSFAPQLDPAPGATESCYLSTYALVNDGSNNPPATLTGAVTDVAWGTDTGYVYGRQPAGTFFCNQNSFVTSTQQFQDPAPGGGGQCFAGPDPAFYTYRGDKGVTLNGLNSTPIAFGGEGRFVFAVMSGSVLCDKSSFGNVDPAPSLPESCYTLTYTREVADDGQPLYLPQGTSVLYGSGLNGNYVSTTVSGSAPTCTAAYDPDPGQTKHCWVARNPGATFQEVDLQDVFVVGGDRNLWAEQAPFGSPPPARQLVDLGVVDIRAVSPTDVFVRGMDGNLWFEHAPFGSPPPARLQVDSNVASFEVLNGQNLLVLDNSQNLWLHGGTVLLAERIAVDSTVQTYMMADPQNIYVVGTDGNLWLETAPFGVVPPARGWVDWPVQAIQAVDAQHVYVMHPDRTLWFEPAPFGAGRQEVEAGIDSFASVDASHVLVLTPDGTLWLESAPFGTVPNPTRTQIDGGVLSFQAIDLTHVMVLDASGNLWLEQSPFGPAHRQQVDAFVPPFSNAGH